MKTEKLLTWIGQIDDSIIVEADTETIRLKPTNRTWLRWVSAAAACIAVAALAIVALVSSSPNEDIFGLPMLTIGRDMGSFGFEGYMAYDINELHNGNPWSESDAIATLPVFLNPTSYDVAGIPVRGLSMDEMIQKANETASAMGLAVDSVYTNPTEEDLRKQQDKERSMPGNESFESDATPYETVAVCGSVTIRVQASGDVRIDFGNGVRLPDGYSFTYYDTSEQQANDVVKYLLEQYESVVDMKSPALDLFGDYNIYAQRGFWFYAYENSGSIIEKIIGYNFNRVKFSPNEDGALWLIDRSFVDLSQKIGDYPIITSQEARELLIQRRYITTVPEAFPGEEHIASVELVYRSGRYDEIFMPYYRFLIEITAMQRDNGLKTFGAFYVPAVESLYLTNMPLWDGSFN